MSINESSPPESAPSRNRILRRFFTTRVIAAMVLVLAALGAGAAAVNNDATNEPSDVDAQNSRASDLILQTVETIVLHPASDVEQTRTYTGLITARRTASLGFERAARIERIYFDDGDLVAEGEQIASLETRRLAARRRQTAARLAAATAVWEESVAGPRVETIAVARAEVDDWRSQLELRKRTFERTKKLRRQNAATDQDIDTSELNLQSTAARLNASIKRLEELEAGTRDEQIVAARAAVDQLEAELADIDIALQDSVIRAPFAGRIAERMLDEGTVVSPGQAVVRLVEHGVLEARIGLPMETAEHLSIGQKIDLQVGDSHPTGKLIRKLPEIDTATRTQMIVIEIEQGDLAGDEQAVPGQVVQVSISQPVRKEGFLLPTASLLPGVRGLWSLFAVEHDDDGNAILQRRHVEVLHTSGDQVLVRGTLTSGDRIVTSGVQRLVEGQQVTVPASHDASKSRL